MKFRRTSGVDPTGTTFRNVGAAKRRRKGLIRGMFYTRLARRILAVLFVLSGIVVYPYLVNGWVSGVMQDAEAVADGIVVDDDHPDAVFGSVNEDWSYAATPPHDGRGEIFIFRKGQRLIYRQGGVLEETVLALPAYNKIRYLGIILSVVLVVIGVLIYLVSDPRRSRRGRESSSLP